MENTLSLNKAGITLLHVISQATFTNKEGHRSNKHVTELTDLRILSTFSGESYYHNCLQAVPCEFPKGFPYVQETSIEYHSVLSKACETKSLLGVFRQG